MHRLELRSISNSGDVIGATPSVFTLGELGALIHWFHLRGAAIDYMKIMTVMLSSFVITEHSL